MDGQMQMQVSLFLCPQGNQPLDEGWQIACQGKQHPLSSVPLFADLVLNAI